ncbi:hypothetical protein ACLOJK_005733 [Asimina triloba]
MQKKKDEGFGLGKSNERRCRGSCGVRRKQKEKEKEKGIDGLDGEDEEFLVDEYESGEEGTMDGGGLKRRDGCSCFNSSEDEDDDADWDEEAKMARQSSMSNVRPPTVQIVVNLLHKREAAALLNGRRQY